MVPLDDSLGSGNPPKIDSMHGRLPFLLFPFPDVASNNINFFSWRSVVMTMGSLPPWRLNASRELPWWIFVFLLVSFTIIPFESVCLSLLIPRSRPLVDSNFLLRAWGIYESNNFFLPIIPHILFQRCTIFISTSLNSEFTHSFKILSLKVLKGCTRWNDNETPYSYLGHKLILITNIRLGFDQQFSHITRFCLQMVLDVDENTPFLETRLCTYCGYEERMISFDGYAMAENGFY